MMVMPATHSGGIVHWLAGKHPGKIGWIISPGDFKEPRSWLPYAVDNGKYTTWKNGEEWDEEGFYALLDRLKFSRHRPLWVAVPDEVGDADTTLWLWVQHERRLRAYGWPLAFVVQDGMAPSDVPRDADVVFVGGTTAWKWQNVATFCASFPQVHVGRVNWHDKLEYCEAAGAESVDGSGFFRAGELSDRAAHLVDFVEGIRRGRQQPELIAR